MAARMLVEVPVAPETASTPSMVWLSRMAAAMPSRAFQKYSLSPPLRALQEDGVRCSFRSRECGLHGSRAAAFRFRRDMPERRQGEDCRAWHGAPRLRRPRLKMLCRFPFPIPFVCAGPEGENGYAPTGRQCVDCHKITLLLRRIGKWGGRQFRHLAVVLRFRRKDVSHPLGRTQNASHYITSLPWRNVSNFTNGRLRDRKAN